MRSSCAQSRKKSGKYHPRLPPELLLRELLIGGVLSAGAAFVFYRSLWGLILGFVIIPVYIRGREERWEKESTQNLQQQFITGMQMVSGSLMAGYSMENAWRRAEKELVVLYGEEAEFCVRMKIMNQRLAVNEPLETVLSDFAAGSGVEEIQDFSEIFSYVKHSGGNLTEVIRSVTDRMQQRAEILADIETAVASKKMEQRMMNLLLPGILLFVTVSSPSYVSTLYHNASGILVMSICLGGYLCCMYWSERITDIRV